MIKNLKPDMKQKNLWMLIIMMTALFATACGSGERKEQSVEADKLIEKAHKAKDYERLMTLADSLSDEGSLSQAKAYYWLGYASDRLNKKRMAEFYWKASLAAVENTGSEEDMDVYAKSASRLANLLTVRGDYVSALRDAIPVVAKLEEEHCDTISDYVNLLIYIGCCQAGIGESGETTYDGFDRAYQKHLDNISKNHTDAAYKDAFAGLINISYALITIKNYESALQWIERFGRLLTDYEQRPDANTDYMDKQLARFNLYKALAYQGLEKKEDAEQAYEAFQTTQFSKIPEGRIMANEYLLTAERWGEAADNYRSLDALMGEQSSNRLLDDIETLLLKKYQTNLIAGRRDSAIAVGMQICDLLKPAFDQANQLEKEEQATIVENVEKLTEQQEEEANKARLRWNILLVLLFLCFLGYVFYRRYTGRQLVMAHRELKEAYEELETSATEKERTATEQRIAQAIHHTFVTSGLPQGKSLSSHISLVPGKSEGRCLYDGYIRDGKLFFCIGDTDETGVQASILTTLTKVQFRTASALETEPERILTAINSAVCKEDRTEGLLRLFLGVLDLATGSLHYSNAGQYVPLLMDDDLDRLEVDENVPIGAKAGYTFTAQEMTLKRGTLLFFYTGALLTAENAEHKKFGEKRLLGSALQGMKLDPNPKPFITSMQDALERFTGGTEPQSDIVLLAVRYTKG